MRVIDGYVIRKGELVNVRGLLTEEQKKRIPYALDKSGQGWRVSGAGMDMGHELVYHIGCAVFGLGDKGLTDLKQRWL
jgi:hypothetical protein